MTVAGTAQDFHLIPFYVPVNHLTHHHYRLQSYNIFWNSPHDDAKKMRLTRIYIITTNFTNLTNWLRSLEQKWKISEIRGL